MPTSLPRLPGNAVVSAAHFNALAEAVASLQAQRRAAAANVTAAFPLEVRRGPGGAHLSLAWTERTAVVELTSDLSAGGSATAQPVIYDGFDWIAEETGEITVYDALNAMDGLTGERALAWFHRQSGLWIIWQLASFGGSPPV